MPQCCAEVNCGSNSARDKSANLSFHRFPSIVNNRGKVDPLGEERRKKWIEDFKRADLTEKKIKYCVQSILLEVCT